jgi:Terminase small subunit
VKDGNGTRSAIAESYSEKSAAVAAARLLTNVNVAAEIAKKSEKMQQKLEITAEKVLRELAKLAFVDPRSFATWEQNVVTVPRKSSFQVIWVADCGGDLCAVLGDTWTGPASPSRTPRHYEGMCLIGSESCMASFL